MQLRARMLWQYGDSLLCRRLLPQALALNVLSLHLLLPGHLLPQAFAVRAVSAGLLLPGRLLPQAAALYVLSADTVQESLRRMRKREIASIDES